MTDYTKLVKALRHCADRSRMDCSGCEYEPDYPCRGKLITDAAAAIEALQAEVDHRIKQIAELRVELGRWVSVAEQAGEPKLGDMVEVVRCKDCRWRHDDSNPMWLPCNEIFPDDNWFCANGAKMEVQE